MQPHADDTTGTIVCWASAELYNAELQRLLTRSNFCILDLPLKLARHCGESLGDCPFTVQANPQPQITIQAQAPNDYLC